MSSQLIFKTTAAILTGLSPMTVSYTIPASSVVEEEMEIETVQQFIDIFCSEKKMEWDEEKEEDVEKLYLIEEINEDNYWIVLEGYALFSTFDIEFQKEIQKWYENPELELEFTYETLCTDALSFLEKIEKEEAEKDKESEQSETDKDKESVKPESAKPESNKDKESVKPEAEKDKETGKEIEKEPSKETGKETVKPESKEESETVKPVPEKQSETKKEINSVVQPEAVPMQAVVLKTNPAEIQPVQPKTETVLPVLNTNTSAKEVSQVAKSFVRAYVSNGNGVIYSTATTYNYKQIISGLSSWNKKSKVEKKEINEYLKSQVGKTYQKLLKEAQSVQFSIVNPSIPTATPSYTGFYGALCALSVGLLGYFRSKYKQL